MKRVPLTARNLRILQICILGVLCLSLVLSAVLSGRCAAAQQTDARGDAELLAFHATELQTAFTDAGFAADGNLYAYALTPADGTALRCTLTLSTVSTLNDTVVLRFVAAGTGETTAGSVIGNALDGYTTVVRAQQETLLEALIQAMTAANGGTAPEGADTLTGEVLLSAAEGKPLHRTAGAFRIDGGCTDADAPELYVLCVCIAQQPEPAEP